MQSLTGKITGDSLTATEWNQLPQEVQNVITALGITLSSGDTNQLGKAVAGYVANGTFYTDSGTVNTYVLTGVGTKQSPTAYTDGLQARFRPGNSNTGPATVNVAGLGVKSIKSASGAALVGGELTANAHANAVYDLANDWFAITAETIADATTTVKGIVELATPAEVVTGTDTTRAITAAGLQGKTASLTAKGIVELATSTETIAGADAVRAVTPAGLQAKVASTTAKGIAELATSAETTTGSDATRVVTPAGLQAKVATVTAKGIAELATDAEAIAGTDTARVVTPAALAATLATIGGSTFKRVASTSDIGLVAGNNNVISFGTLNIPATGRIRLEFSGRINNDSGSLNRFGFGVKIGASYFYYKYDENGTIVEGKDSETANLQMPASQYRIIYGSTGTDISALKGPSNFYIDIETTGITTGSNTVEFGIEATGSATIKGTLETSVFTITVEESV